MNQGLILITNMPPEITTNILSRLPIRTVVACKIVCKPWLELLETREFAISHLSKSVPGLVVYHCPDLFRVFEFNDEPDLEHHELHYELVTEINHTSFINPSHRSICIQGSTNGLLLFREINTQPHVHYICNPITRDYIEIPSPDGLVHSYPTTKTYGFGASKITSQHKVVRILHECTIDKDTNACLDVPKSECHVYTLGTGSWRKITHGSKFVYNSRSVGALLNGCLHWLVLDLNGMSRISCFDLETELFSTFLPPCAKHRPRLLRGLFVLGDCLCVCDNSSEDEIVIWLMKEYGDDKSWSKEYVINKHPDDHAGECYEVVRPMKVFKDGDILMAWQDYFVFYYSNKTKITSNIDLFDLRTTFGIDSSIHTSSFLSLKYFNRENVRSF